MATEAEAEAAVFLSTPSLRRATVGVHSRVQGHADFYPRPPCGGRHVKLGFDGYNSVFLSTPSLRRATYSASAKKVDDLFLSTPSLRRATHHAKNPGSHSEISIHALLAEGDAGFDSKTIQETEFLSTPSLRRATWLAALNTSLREFLSTPSLRREL